MDIAAARAEIEAVKGPGPDPVLPSERPLSWTRTHIPRWIRVNKLRCAVIVVLFIPCPILLATGGIKANMLAVLQLLFVAVIAVTSRVNRRARLPFSLDHAQERWRDALKRYRKYDSRAGFDAKRKQLCKLCDELVQLQTKDPGTHPAYVNLRKRGARNLFMRSVHLADADIPGLSDASRAHLLAKGVKTAADCHANKLMPVADSDATYRAVRDWRERVAKRFHFDAKAPLPPKMERDFADKFLDWQSHARFEIAFGAKHLRDMTRWITRNRAKNYRYLADAWEAVCILEAREKAGKPSPKTRQPPRRNER